MSESIELEARALGISMKGAFALAAWGLAMAWVTASDAVLLDGMFNLISGVMTFVSIWITRLVHQRRSTAYPLGYFAYESLFVVAKGMSILVLIVFAVWGSVEAMLAGGRELRLGLMTIYVAVAVPGCVFLWWTTRRAFQQSGSGILHAESTAWLINALISGAIGGAFVGVMLLEGSSWGWLGRYIDQILVIFLSLLTIRDPYLLFRNGIRELVLMAPDKDHVAPVREAIARYADEQAIDVIDLEVMKMGRQTWVSLVVNPRADVIRMDDYMRVKRTFADIVRGIHADSTTELILDRPPA